MLYAILIYGEEGVFERLDPEQQEDVMKRHHDFQKEYGDKGTLGPVARLMGTASAVTVRKQGDSVVVLDGPFAETKEHLLGLYVISCETIEEAIEAARKFSPEVAAYEVRPVRWGGQMGSLSTDA